MDDIDFDFENRIVTPEFRSEDNDVELSLRPKFMSEYIGQGKVKENLSVYIKAAKGRGELLTTFYFMAHRDSAKLHYPI